MNINQNKYKTPEEEQEENEGVLLFASYLHLTRDRMSNRERERARASTLQENSMTAEFVVNSVSHLISADSHNILIYLCQCIYKALAHLHIMLISHNCNTGSLNT